jgi:hypothetical protein
LQMLMEQPKRNLYEGAAPGGKKGSGLFYVDYSDGDSPTLNFDDIEVLLKEGKITIKYSGCYVLALRPPESRSAVKGKE